MTRAERLARLLPEVMRHQYGNAAEQLAFQDGCQDMFDVVDRQGWLPPEAVQEAVCADCGRFIKHAEVGSRYVPQYGEPGDPETEFYHGNGCPSKHKEATR